MGNECELEAQGRSRYAIQKHRATRLHYDLRLEIGGVMKSWAIPKGPSSDPSVRRLALAVHDHPIAFAFFEGILPAGGPGGGTIMVWDHGVFVVEGGSPGANLEGGRLVIRMNGEKLRGRWSLLRSRSDLRSWFLRKLPDSEAREEDVTARAPFSALTSRTLAEIAMDEGGQVELAADGDPAPLPDRGPARRRQPWEPTKVWLCAPEAALS